MCSIGEDDFGDDGGAHLMANEIPVELEDSDDICKKCNINKCAVMLSLKKAQCRNCFLAYVRHKFRATLGSSKILPKEAQVLVVFDGSPESVVLLDMIYFGVTQDSFKRLRCCPKIVYIDDHFLFESKKSYIFLIKEMLSKYNMKSYLMSVSSDKSPIDYEDVQNEEMFKTEETIFKNHFENITTLTSQQDFLSKIHYNKIKSAASHLGCKFVFLPDISPNIATNLLGDIILGRGGSAALDASLVDDRVPNLKMIRPIKDLSEKEIQFYIELNNLKALKNCKFGETNVSNSSLQNLTKAFVENLQKNFPATVSTVFRIGDKLAPTNFKENKNLYDLEVNLSKCIFCYSPLDYVGSKALFATEFSRLASCNASDSIRDLGELESRAKTQLDSTQSDVLRNLCSGCRNIYRENPLVFSS